MLVTQLEPLGGQPDRKHREDKDVTQIVRKSAWLKISILILLVSLGVLVYLWSQTLPPSTETRDVLIDIKNGSNVRLISEELAREGIIKSPTMFTLLAIWTNAEKSLGSGVFIFKTPLNIFSVLEQIRLHDRGIERLKITIPEGATLAQMSIIFAKKLPDFNIEDFTRETEGMEGYLFPDTYFFYANATSGPIISALSQNYTIRTQALVEEAMLTNKNWVEIMVMASLIEEEAVEDVDRKIISGILWSRIKIGMRLQVDAPFVYIMGKASSEITLDDLKYDSPYNTYLYGGLPPKPISNPGILAIDAAMHPTDTMYVYYLSDKNGVMHYARTFEEHKRNKEKYLR